MTDEFGSINELPPEANEFLKAAELKKDEQAQQMAVDALRALPGKRRSDWAYNPDDVFICPNGHLQYNLCEEEIEEMRVRGIKRPPICYDGGLCRNCTEAIEKLTSDPKELQYKLSTAMLALTQVNMSVQPLMAVNKDMNEIALFLRHHYDYEIGTGKEQHNGSGSKAVIYYLRIERGRFVVRAGKIWRAVLHALGVQ